MGSKGAYVVVDNVYNNLTLFMLDELQHMVQNL